MNLIETSCPGCHDARQHQVQDVAGEAPAPSGPWRLVECESCATIYLRPRPSDPLELYQDPNYHVHRRAGTLARLVLWFVAVFEAARLGYVAGRGGRVFEIGCGQGQVLAMLARWGFVVAGVEASAAAVGAATARGLRVEQASFADHRGVSGHYDVVFAAHVLEHVADPRGFLREARRLVRADGVIVLKFPVVGSWDADLFGGQSGCFDVPYHVMVPSRAALEGLLKEENLALVRLRNDWVPNDWVHGLRRTLAESTGWSFRFVRPSNPLFSLCFLPFSLAAALVGKSGRVRATIRKVQG